MEKISNTERNSSVTVEKMKLLASSTKLSESVNELCDKFDENENEVKCNSVQIAHGNAISCPTDYSIGSLVPDMKNLRLSQQERETEYCIAGYIKAIIPPSETLVIQHATGSKILNVGTAIFTQKFEDQVNSYEEIGLVADIFGSVNEPMYALQLKREVASEFLPLDSEVFYLQAHPTTRFISVECDENDKYTVMYS